jgi:sec-independent protein translocase protein TatB
MFDIGWTELLVIAVVLIVVVGPKDLPPMLRAFGKTMTRFRKVAGEFRAQFDEALKEADLDEVRQHIADAQRLNPANSLREAMNPLRQMGNDIKADLQRSTTVDRPQTADTQMLPSPVQAPALEEQPIAPMPVIAPPPAVVAEKAKAARKPRVKAETVVEQPSIVEPAQVGAPEISEKPKRAPRKTPAVASVADAPAVATSEKRLPATKSSETKAAAMLVEPAQVGLSAVEKPKRAPRKIAAALAITEIPVAAPAAKTRPAKKPATKKDDA